MARKNIMRRFRMGEISSVDRPAQPGARAVLLKRDDSAIVDKDDPGYSPDNDDAVAKAKRELRMEKDLEKALAKIAALEADIAKRDADLAAANAVLSMTAPHRAHYDKLNKAAQDSFLKLDGAGRDQQIEYAKNADPVVYTTKKGVEIRKSAGEQVLQMAKDNDANAEALEKANATNTEASITKRANEDLSNLAGDEATRKAVVKALDTIEDETVRKAAFASVKSANTAAAAAFKKEGTKDGGTPSSESGSPLEKLNELAKARAAADKVSFAKGMDLVMQTPEGAKLYTESQTPKAA